MHGTFAETRTAAAHSTDLQHFDIVLMDISTPEMDDYETTRAIRSRDAARDTPMLPILALTVHDGKSCREEWVASGMQGMLSKPFRSAAALQAAVACSGPDRQDRG